MDIVWFVGPQIKISYIFQVTQEVREATLAAAADIPGQEIDMPRPPGGCYVKLLHTIENTAFSGKTISGVYWITYIHPQTKFAKVMFYTCLSVILFTEGSTWAGTPPRSGTPRTGTPPRQVLSQAGTLPPQQVNPFPPWQVHPPGRYTPPGKYTPTPRQVHPPMQVHPPGRYTPLGRYTPPQAGILPWVSTPPPPGRYTPYAGTPPRQVHPPLHTPPARYTHPEQCMLGDTGNKRAVRILLECILVY